eukprot:TRINITY_DN2628_c0_g2_i1.p1 TRINITY_DN2628_c0_g2~~TRINITY_DN2628_c0_g2_i1.p1  ORF type:complete len:786 (-),score=178.06 TRINITY_DN2628_c0_g2_i1:106-2463(-)
MPPTRYVLNSEPNPNERWSHSQTSLGTKVYICGGYSTSGYKNDAWILQRGKYRQLRNMDISRSQHSASFVQNRYLFVYGGRNNSSQRFLNHPRMYDTERNLWYTPKIAGREFLPIVCQHASVTIRPNAIVIFGGFDGKHDSNNVFLFEFSDDCRFFRINQCTLEGTIANPVKSHGMVYLENDDSIIVFGGAAGAKYSLNNTFHLFVVDLDRKKTYWKIIHSDVQLAPRWGMGMSSIKQDFVIYGGKGQKVDLSDVHVGRLLGDSIQWSYHLERTSPNPSRGMGMSLVPTRANTNRNVGRKNVILMVIFGGFMSDGTYSKETAVLRGLLNDDEDIINPADDTEPPEDSIIIPAEPTLPDLASNYSAWNSPSNPTSQLNMDSSLSNGAVHDSFPPGFVSPEPQLRRESDESEYHIPSSQHSFRSPSLNDHASPPPGLTPLTTNTETEIPIISLLNGGNGHPTATSVRDNNNGDIYDDIFSSNLSSTPPPPTISSSINNNNNNNNIRSSNEHDPISINDELAAIMIASEPDVEWEGKISGFLTFALNEWDEPHRTTHCTTLVESMKALKLDLQHVYSSLCKHKRRVGSGQLARDVESLDSLVDIVFQYGQEDVGTVSNGSSNTPSRLAPSLREQQQLLENDRRRHLNMNGRDGMYSERNSRYNNNNNNNNNAVQSNDLHSLPIIHQSRQKNENQHDFFSGNSEAEDEIERLKKKLRIVKDCLEHICVCQICMEGVASTALKCGHFFCPTCVKKSKKCVVCHAPIRVCLENLRQFSGIEEEVKAILDIK